MAENCQTVFRVGKTKAHQETFATVAQAWYINIFLIQDTGSISVGKKWGEPAGSCLSLCYGYNIDCPTKHDRLSFRLA